MATVTKEFVEALPVIYRDILGAFPEIEPARKEGDALAFQTLYERLRNWPRGDSFRSYVEADRRNSYSIREIVQACENMQKHGVVEIKDEIFVSPTPVGEELISLLTGKRAGEFSVPDFPPLMQD